MNKLDQVKKNQYSNQFSAFQHHKIGNPNMALNIFFSIPTATAL